MALTPAQAGLRLTTLRNRFQGTVSTYLLEATAEKALEVAKEQSLGPKSLYRLRRENFPFSTAKHEVLGEDPFLINKQKGRVYRGWEVVQRGSHFVLINRVAYFRKWVIPGTSKMHGRPEFMSNVVREVRNWRRQHLRQLAKDRLSEAKR